MAVIITDNKIVIITKPKTIYFDLPEKVDNNLKHEIYLIVEHNEFLAEHIMKNEIS